MRVLRVRHDWVTELNWTEFLLKYSWFVMFQAYSKVIQLSVQFSRSVMSDSLWPHGLQHTRLPCPSPTPRAGSNSCLLRQWCHPPIPFSVVRFSCIQCFPDSVIYILFQIIFHYKLLKYIKYNSLWYNINYFCLIYI